MQILSVEAKRVNPLHYQLFKLGTIKGTFNALFRWNVWFRSAAPLSHRRPAEEHFFFATAVAIMNNGSPLWWKASGIPPLAGAHAGQRQQAPWISASIRIPLSNIYKPIETENETLHPTHHRFVL